MVVGKRNNYDGSSSNMKLSEIQLVKEVLIKEKQERQVIMQREELKGSYTPSATVHILTQNLSSYVPRGTTYGTTLSGLS
uniref:Uncharacterized protein n=1 Tax=Vespula pensylvanica TaxID=30213 RepID=A0A834P3Y5_VESPE|nr:hypothetical protein H0235_007074 [Vespula pensylvanica]